jgi:hypothetical protein
LITVGKGNKLTASEVLLQVKKLVQGNGTEKRRGLVFLSCISSCIFSTGVGVGVVHIPCLAVCGHEKGACH